MTLLEILDKWADYSEYDEKQSKFNMASLNYEFHGVGNMVKILLKEYDPTGLLPVLYVKYMFKKAMKKTSVKAWDMLSNKDFLCEEKEMLNALNDSCVIKNELRLYDTFENVYLQATKGKRLGENPDLHGIILESIINCIKDIRKLNAQLYIKGGKIGDISSNIYFNILSFRTMTECLLTMEKMDDGFYICFITADGSALCFFSYIIKNNGNILSINDMSMEHYIGELGNARNARWTEEKASSIFPYDSELFEYSEHDYKGYATEYHMKENIKLYELGEEKFLPIIAGFLLLSMKYSNKELDMPLCYIDSMLPENRKLLNTHEIISTEANVLAETHSMLNLSFDMEKMLKGEYSEEFNYSHGKHHLETGCFDNQNQLMVDLWGQGFEYDEKLNQGNNTFYLLGECKKYVSEFVGNEQRQRLQIYKDIRTQLADYMINKIYEEWSSKWADEYGCISKIRKWYEEALLKNMDLLVQMAKEFEEQDPVENTTSIHFHFPGNPQKNECGYAIIELEKNAAYNYSHPYEIVLGSVKKNHRLYDEEDGCLSNVLFLFKPRDWKAIELFIGQEVPKIIKGWKADGHEYNGNPLLSACDKVDIVGTPFEYYRDKQRKDWFYKCKYDFKFVLAFSKRHWNKLKKAKERTEKIC